MRFRALSKSPATYVILYCEGYTTPIKTNLEEVKDLLYRDIHEKKLRIAMAKTFDQLKEDSAHVDNFLAGNIKLPKKEESGRGRYRSRPALRYRPGIMQ